MCIIALAVLVVNLLVVVKVNENNKKLNINEINFNNFANPSLIHRIKYGGGGKQAIAKAVGIKHNKSLKIIDATAGLGTDTFVLASLNCRVYAIERNIIIYNLLKKRLETALTNNLLANFANNITIHFGSSMGIIADIIKKNIFIPDVIYLDPMFPTNKKTAAPNKQIQLLKNITAEQPDQPNLLVSCLKYNHVRIAVKRPKNAAYLEHIQPNFSLLGKANRFDIYLPAT